jgi:hypothetical protein
MLLLLGIFSSPFVEEKTKLSYFFKTKKKKKKKKKEDKCKINPYDWSKIQIAHCGIKNNSKVFKVGKK